MRLAQIAALPLMASTSVLTRSKEIAIARRALPDSRQGQVGSVLITLILLLGVVALASRHSLGEQAGGVGSVRDAVTALWLFALLAMTLLLALIGPMLWRLRRRHPDEPVAKPRRLRAGWALLLVVLAVALGLGTAFVIGVLQVSHVHPRVIVWFGKGRAHVSAPAPAAGPVSRPSDRVILAGVGMLVAIGVFWAVVALRTRRRRRPDVGPEAALRVAIEDSLADLDSALTPREAVIRTYARMQAVLAGQGLAHGSSEAPREYLARAVEMLGDKAERAHSLTELFEEARFSTHEIDEPMRQDAIAALDAMRSTLVAGAPA